MYEVKESFEWMAPEFKVMDSGKNTIRIKGVALKGNVVSRNKRKYVDEELKKAARTFVGKPVTINHDMNQKIGTVIWMEYENGALEYLADIKKQPYVGMLRDHSTNIRGVSIEAAYLHNQCPRCGDKFYNEEDFHHHMNTIHFIKTDSTKEVHGILGQALSLVLSPEEPGYSDSTIELMESYRKPVLRLLETVITTKKEKLKEMKKKLQGKAVISPQQRTTIHTIKKLAEQDEAPSPPCPEGWQEVEGKCVKIEATEQEEYPSPPCPDGWHEVEGACVRDTPEATEQDETPSPPCPEGWHEADGKCVKNVTEQENHGCLDNEHWDAEQGKCVLNVTEQEDHGCADDEHWDGEKCVLNVAEQVVTPEPVELTGEPPALEPKCPEGFHREGEACVVDEPPATMTELPAAPAPVIPAETPPSPAPIPPETVSVVAEIEQPKLPLLLTLGEFGGTQYEDMNDCIAKNQDKGDPAAHCAEVSRKSHGESFKETTLNTTNLYEGIKQLHSDSTNRQRASIKRDVVIADSVNSLNKSAAKIVKNTMQLKGAILAQSKHFALQNSHINEYLASQNSRINEQSTASCAEAKRTLQLLSELNSSIKTLREYSDKKLGQLATAQLRADKTTGTRAAKQALNKVVAELHTVKPLLDKTVAELYRTIKQNAEKTIVKKTVAELYRTIERNAKKTKAIKESFNASIREIKSLATEQKKDFENILSVADKNAEDLKEHVKSLEEWKKAKEEEEPKACPAGEHRNEAGECVPDEPPQKTEELKTVLKEMLEPIQTQIENLDSKLKGRFKGHSPQVKETVKDHPEDPLKKKPHRRRNQ